MGLHRELFEKCSIGAFLVDQRQVVLAGLLIAAIADPHLLQELLKLQQEPLTIERCSISMLVGPTLAQHFVKAVAFHVEYGSELLP